MWKKYFKNDLVNNKSTIVALLILLTISIILMSLSVSIILTTINSTNSFFEKSKVSHYTQMQVGDFSRDGLNEFIDDNEFISSSQVVTMLNVDGNSITYNDKQFNKQGIVDFSLVKQNEEFDYLLDSNNNIVEIESNNIGVPIYLKDKYNLSIGDEIVVWYGNTKQVFYISEFIRDSMMNPSIISSKRFLISDEMFEQLENNFNQEYLVEFRLNDTKNLKEFSNNYIENTDIYNLPNNGPAIDLNVVKLFQGITDGLVAILILFSSVLFTLISLLCIRYVLLITVEEDFMEIAQMKAIGISKKVVSKIYSYKYLVIGFFAVFFGTLLSQLLLPILTSNIDKYMGVTQISVLQYLIILFLNILILLFIYSYCKRVVRKIYKFEVTEALQYDAKKSKGRLLNISKNKSSHIFSLIGFKDVFINIRKYLTVILLLIGFIFVITVPINIYSTLNDSDFVMKMGIGKSDILINNKQYDEDLDDQLINELSNDDSIIKYEVYRTIPFEITDSTDKKSNLNIQVGDFSNFKIAYIDGTYPKNNNEIALSRLLSDERDLSIGDSFDVENDGVKYNVTVTGIYEDITNGGKTAKAVIDTDSKATSSYIQINLKNQDDIINKVGEYQENYPDLETVSIDDYVKNSFSSISQQIFVVCFICLVVSLLLIFVITLLFTKLKLNTDYKENSIMNSLGISLKNIKQKYIVQNILVAIIAIIFGTVFSKIFGEKFMGTLFSIFGVSQIDFYVNAVIIYLVVPVLILCVIILMTYIVLKNIKIVSINYLTKE